MSSPVLEHIEASPIPLSPQRGSYSMPIGLIPVSDIPVSAAKTADLTELDRLHAGVDGLGVVRGLRSALIIQGGGAILLYGVWYFWHLLR